MLLHTYRLQYKHNFVYTEKQKKKFLRLKILTWLWWSGTEPNTPPRFACIYSSCRCRHAQSYLTLYDLLNCSPPGSSVHGVFQARILEWVAIPLSRVSSWPRDQTRISCICRWILYCWATWETSGIHHSSYLFCVFYTPLKHLNVLSHLIPTPTPVRR